MEVGLVLMRVLALVSGSTSTSRILAKEIYISISSKGWIVRLPSLWDYLLVQYPTYFRGFELLEQQLVQQKGKETCHRL